MASITTAAIGEFSNNQPVRRRWSRLRIVGWLFGLIVIGGMVASVLLPSLCKAREPANRAKCASNLHQIGLAIALYAQENGGKFPPSLATLYQSEQLTPAVMICPSGNDEVASADDAAGIAARLEAAETNAPRHQNCMSYIYVGQKFTDKTAGPTSIVAYEPLSDHQDGTNVLFGDGHAEFVNKSEWQKVAAAAGVTVVDLPATQPTK